jgi:3-oxoacyl-[acyl-carrier protein] reductase
MNNAAVFSTITLKPFWELSVNEWDRLMAVNVRGTWLTMKAVVPPMREAGGGSIINISSTVVAGGRPNYLHYVASKAAVIGMTRSAARELGDFGIRVNCIMPGTIQTEVPRETVSPERRAALIASQSIKRAATPDDLVGVASFLASSDSQYMTGQTLDVDGGNTFL